MRRVIMRALLALTMVLGITLTSGTVAGAQAQIACNTWQYRVLTTGPIYQYPGGPRTDKAAYAGDYLNASITGDKWYRGNFYTPEKVKWAYGWITKDRLTYVTCW